MSKGFKVSKEGVDVKTAADKDLLISSQFDTFKIFRTGSLSLSLPSETFKNDIRTHTAIFSHDLGYIPFISPTINIAVNNPAPYTEEGNFMTGEGIKYKVTTPYSLNDVDEEFIPPGPFGFGGPHIMYEVAHLELTSTQLKIVIERGSFVQDGEGGYWDVEFTASVATLYYTIFYNRIDEAMDLL